LARIERRMIMLLAHLPILPNFHPCARISAIATMPSPNEYYACTVDCMAGDICRPPRLQRAQCSSARCTHRPSFSSPLVQHIRAHLPSQHHQPHASVYDGCGMLPAWQCRWIGRDVERWRNIASGMLSWSLCQRELSIHCWSRRQRNTHMPKSVCTTSASCCVLTMQWLRVVALE